MQINADILRKGIGYNDEGRQTWQIQSAGVGSLKSLDAIVNNPQDVDEISLEGNYFKSIEPPLSMFTTLRILDLSLNLITTISNLSDFPYLETLNLSSNRIRRIENLNDLTALHL
jgi:Leucine-rich repeat (LRR) protein